MHSSPCSGAVLAGGASKRFNGVAKGVLEVGGRRIVDRVADALRAVTDELFLITNDASVRDAMPELTTFADVRAERGSLIGLHTALVYCRHAVLVAAWDMPFLSPALLSWMREQGERESMAVIPEGPIGPEPLCAYYPRGCIAIAEKQIESGELRLSAFVDALPKKLVVSRGEVTRFGPATWLFANVNTAADLALAQSVVNSPSALLEHR